MRISPLLVAAVSLVAGSGDGRLPPLSVSCSMSSNCPGLLLLLLLLLVWLLL
jgi:hypothetical protein